MIRGRFGFVHEPVFRSPVVTDRDVCDQVLSDLTLRDVFGYFVSFFVAANASVRTDLVEGCWVGIGYDVIDDMS